MSLGYNLNIPKKDYNMPKPILTIGISYGSDVNIRDAKSLQEIGDNVTGLLKNEYWVITYFTNKEDPIFQVFYEKDFNEIKYEELKNLILCELKKPNVSNEKQEKLQANMADSQQ